MAFPSFAWKYVPSSGVPNPPRCPSWHPEPASGAHWVARHWLKLGSAGRAPGARLAFWAGWAFRGFASRWARAGPIGVLVASPRSADGRWWAPSARLPSGHHRRALWRARARLRAARAHRESFSRRARGAPPRRRERRPTPAAEPPPSNGARLPAELKHITKRRKRNQQGCP
jgi:hypothetical protein